MRSSRSGENSVHHFLMDTIGMNNRIWLTDALRLHFDERLSRTEVARRLGIPDSTLFEFFSRFHKQGLPWPLPEGMACEKLEVCLYPGRNTPDDTLPAPGNNVPVAKRRKRPNFPQAFRLALVAQSMQPGVSVAQLARENDINTNLLFNWRQRYAHLLDAPGPAEMEPQATTCDVVPVVVQQASLPDPGSPGMHRTTQTERHREILCEVTVGRVKIRLSGELSPALLQTLVRELKGGRR